MMGVIGERQWWYGRDDVCMKSTGSPPVRIGSKTTATVETWTSNTFNDERCL